MIPNIRQQVRYLVEIFLDARSLVIPKPRRPPRPTLAVREESQEESQEGYNNFDLDLNDPELWAALEGSDISPLSDELSSKERRVAEVICYISYIMTPTNRYSYMFQLIDTHISPAIYRMVCKHFNETSTRVSPFASDDTDAWIDCWVGCAGVLVQNGRRVSTSSLSALELCV